VAARAERQFGLERVLDLGEDGGELVADAGDRRDDGNRDTRRDQAKFDAAAPDSFFRNFLICFSMSIGSSLKIDLMRSRLTETG